MSEQLNDRQEQYAGDILSVLLPHGWARASIGELGKVRLGRQRSPKNRSDKFPTKYLRAANITWAGLDLTDVLEMDFRPIDKESYRLHQGDVVLSEASGSAKEVGKPALWSGQIADCCFQNTVIRFRPSDAIDPKFALHSFSHYALNGVFSRASKGVGIHHLSADRFSILPLLIPPLNEQQQIADTIDELFSDLDAGVAALQRVRTKLRHYRAAVLKAAVEGALTAEWRKQHPATEPASAVLTRILAERRRLWEQGQRRKFAAAGKEPPRNWKAKYKEPVAPDTTKLPPLPKRWCWAGWNQIGVFQNGRPFPSKDYQDSGTKLLRPGNLYANGTVGWTERNTRFMPERYAEETPGLIVGGGELVINLTAQSLKDEFLGRVCLTKNAEHCLLNQRLARLTPIVVTPQFMLWMFKSSHFRKFVDTLNTGSLIQHMFTSQLEDFVLPLPPLDEQEAIVEAVEDQLSVIEHIEVDVAAKLKSTQALRQSILGHAFTGQLVPHDPHDEPASELLNRIAAEREERTRKTLAAKRANTKTKTPRRRAAKNA